MATWKCCVWKENKGNKLEGNTLRTRKGIVLTKQCKNIKAKLLLMVFHTETRKVKLNKDAYLTKTDPSCLPNLSFLCLDIHITEYWKKNFFHCVKIQIKSLEFFKTLFHYTWNLVIELNSNNLTLNRYTNLYLFFSFFNENRPKQSSEKI